MPRKPSPASTPDEILTAEFEYIANTAFQANEDRARAASFYLVTFGSFIAALVSAQLNITSEPAKWLTWGFSGLFTALAFMGLVTVLQLARLRLAWLESVNAMNAIKEYYLTQYPGIEPAIRWRNDPKILPGKFKITSIGFLLVIEVAVLGGASLGAGIFFAIQAISGVNGFLPSFAMGLLYCGLLLEVYRQLLK